MRTVRREEIVDYVTYEDMRPRFRARVMVGKEPRRAHLGEHLTLLFENPLTIRYQIQEMIRAERIVREADIQNEIETYNEILGGDGELGCTLLVEIEDPEQRAEMLRDWWDLPERIYVRLEDGKRVLAKFDARQRGDGQLSSVQYLKFDVGGRAPSGAGVDMPDLVLDVSFSPETRRALADDLAGTEPAETD